VVERRRDGITGPVSLVRSHRAAVVLVASASLASLASSGCIVLKKDYDQCVTDAAGYRAAAETKQKEDAGALLSLQERLTAAESATQDRDTKLADLSTATHNLQAQLDEATAINQQLRGELQRLGKDVDKILADKGTLAKALDDAKARLDELRKAQAAAEARTLLFKDFGQRFKSLVDAGQLRIETRRGQLVVEVTGICSSTRAMPRCARRARASSWRSRTRSRPRRRRPGGFSSRTTWTTSRSSPSTSSRSWS